MIFLFHEAYGFQSDYRLIWADTCNEDLLGHYPQHIHRAPRSNVRSNNPDIRELYIHWYIEKYKCEDVINNSQNLASFFQKSEDGYNMHDEIIHLHASIATKIEMIQLEVDKSLSQFFTGQVPWSQTLQVCHDCIDY